MTEFDEAVKDTVQSPIWVLAPRCPTCGKMLPDGDWTIIEYGGVVECSCGQKINKGESQ